MVIQCDQCQTKFRLPDSKLKPGGVKVRCSNCKHVFTVMPQEAAPVEEQPVVTKQEPPQFAAQEEPTAPTGPTESEGGEPQEESAPGEFDFGDFGGAPDEQAFAVSEEEPSAGFDFGSGLEEDESTITAEDRGQGLSGEATEFELDSGGAAEGELGFGEAKEKTELSGFDLDQGSGATDEFDFDEESVSSDDFGFEEESGSPDEFDFGEEPSGAEDFGFDEESGATDEFEFGDENLFAEEPPADKEGDDEEFTFTELPVEASAAEPVRNLEASPVRDTPDAFAVEGGVDDHLSDELLLEPSAPEMKGRKAKKTKEAKAKGPMSRVMSLVLLLLLLLTAAAAYLYLQSGGTAALPSLESLVERLTGGSGAVQVKGHIEVAGEAGRYVKNNSAGSLLVIEGRAINRYPQSRAIIQVRGLLYDGNGRLLGQQLAYCGNHLSDSDLQRLPYAKIEEAMKNTFGEALSNLEIAPGKDIPFALVFKDLPANLDSFAVEVVDSQPASSR